MMRFWDVETVSMMTMTFMVVTSLMVSVNVVNFFPYYNRDLDSFNNRNINLFRLNFWMVYWLLVHWVRHRVRYFYGSLLLLEMWVHEHRLLVVVFLTLLMTLSFSFAFFTFSGRDFRHHYHQSQDDDDLPLKIKYILEQW